MNCTATGVPTAQLEPRIQGDLRDTRVAITDDDVAIDPSGYSWLAEGAPAGSTTKAWSTSTISADGADVLISWAAGDLGACTPGDWWIELTGTQGGKSRPKVRLLITIEAEIS